MKCVDTWQACRSGKLRQWREGDVERLDAGVRRLINPHIYHVALIEGLWMHQQQVIAAEQVHEPSQACAIGRGGTPMELVWRLLPVALVASRAEVDRPIDSRVLNDQVPAILVALAERMLSSAGNRVVFSFERLDLRALLTHGASMPAAGVELRPGEPNACHRNSAQQWQGMRTTTQIATGFALSVEEGLWRRHSWLVHNDGHIIETTTKRDRYYGFILHPAQTERFVAENQAQQADDATTVQERDLLGASER